MLTDQQRTALETHIANRRSPTFGALAASYATSLAGEVVHYALLDAISTPGMTPTRLGLRWAFQEIRAHVDSLENSMFERLDELEGLATETIRATVIRAVDSPPGTTLEAKQTEYGQLSVALAKGLTVRDPALRAELQPHLERLAARIAPLRVELDAAEAEAEKNAEGE